MNISKNSLNEIVPDPSLSAKSNIYSTKVDPTLSPITLANSSFVSWRLVTFSGTSFPDPSAKMAYRVSFRKYFKKSQIQWSLPKRTSREADNPLQRTDLVARIELRSVLLMDKQSPRSGHLSTTDKSPVPDVSVIQRLHCITKERGKIRDQKGKGGQYPYLI